MCSLSTLLLLNGLSSNAVHVHNSLPGESLTHGNGGSFLRIELCGANKLSFLELHQAEADALSSSLAVVLGSNSWAVLGAVVLAKTINSDLLASVELIRD